MKKSISRIIGLIMLIVAIVFIVLAVADFMSCHGAALMSCR